MAAVLLPALAFPQLVQVRILSESEIQSRLESGTVDRRERQPEIRKLFEEAGCAPSDQPVDKHNGNVVCTLAGETPSTIIVGGHFDFADRGKGIVDDWSGTSLLPSLYQGLKFLRRHHTFLFVAFANEELGLAGSRHFVKAMAPEQKTAVQAFVNLECLGLTPAKVWVTRSTPALVARLRDTAAAIGMGLEGMNVERVGDDDTHPFLSARIPVISIHSITRNTLRILHSPFDRLDAIHFHDYYQGYRLVAYYLAYLDLTLP